MTLTPFPRSPEDTWAELARNWRLLGACTIGFGLSLSGIPFYTLGVFVDPLHAAFGWSVGQVQIGLTISYLTTMAILPAVGWLADRIGVRVVALVSLTGLGLAFMALGLQRGQLWAFWLNWFFISLFGTGTLAITWTRPLTHAFKAGRGLALGLSLLGTGVIGIFGPPAARALIDAVGWHWAYVCLGAAPILIAVPTTLLFFRDPAPTGADHRPQGLPAPLRDPRLWLLGFAFLLIAGGVSGTITNLIKAVTSEGVSRADAVAAASLVGLFVVIGRVGCGALIDRFWAPGMAAIFVMGPATACALLASGPARPGVAAISAALIGLTAGAEFDLLPFLIGRFLPLERYTGSLAAGSACFYLGAAAGGPLLAWFYDHLGSYRLGLWGASGLFAIAAVALLCLGPYPVFVSASAPPRSGSE
jgi:MFS family permease